MAFIIKTQGIEPGDLVSDMKAEAIKSIMHYYPRIENNEHLDNIAKRKIHNEGVNKIDYYTSKKRAKLEQQEDGTFVNNAVPIQYAVFDENATEFLTADMNGEKDGSDFELTLSIRQLMRKYSGRRQRFIKLLLGFDKDFSAWLIENKITKARNDEYMDRCHSIDTYIQHCFEFLGLSEKRGQRFLRKMRKHLKDAA